MDDNEPRYIYANYMPLFKTITYKCEEQQIVKKSLNPIIRNIITVAAIIIPLWSLWYPIDNIGWFADGALWSMAMRG